MSTVNSRSVLVLLIVVLMSTYTHPVAAASQKDAIQKMQESLAKQEALVKSQQEMLAAQTAKLAAQEKEISENRAKLDQLITQMAGIENVGEKEKSVHLQDAALLPKDEEKKVSGARRGKKQNDSSSTAIVSPKKEPVRPDVPVLANSGGVLTPKGVLMYENTLEYLNTTSNVFTFDGVKLADVVFVGVTNATTAKRQVTQDSNRFRLGLTDRLEADVRIPYVYRNDTTTDTDTNTSITTKTTIEGDGLGDIDGGLAYQINRGLDNWPFLIANLRYKANNADGPYDVSYDDSNIATELPTGTGFNSFETSLTAIKVSDPAVLFTNLGYVYNIKRSIDKTFGTMRVLDVDPGNAINASAGMGFSINPDLSFTLGYKHSYVFSTDQETLNLSTNVYSMSESDTANVGALMVGANYRINPITSFNMNVEVGATREAPDLRVGFRVPVRLGKVF